jgi:hypothetical protein
VGLNIQDERIGVFLSSDCGIGKNMSLGLTANYLLAVNKDGLGNSPDFGQRVDLKALFNTNLGSIMKLAPNIAVYPRLNLGLHNFGDHLGFRYFFTDGFGLFKKAGVPIAKYDKNTTGFDRLNNPFILNIGASFML